jgi:UDP-arabinose 4-epimerase
MHMCRRIFPFVILFFNLFCGWASDPVRKIQPPPSTTQSQKSSLQSSSPLLNDLGCKFVLVTGGAGYIGTQTCKALQEAGYLPLVYDNLSTGQEEGLKWGTFVKGDVSDRKKLGEIIDQYHPIAVIHVAAFKCVGESVKDPAKYYFNNLCGSLILLDVMREKGVKKIIFSSTASAYGSPEKPTPIKESTPCQPINPYGNSKWMVEKIINDFKDAYGFQYVILRYFNVAGADLKGECGERGSPANLIPIIFQVACKKRKELEVFGRDYPTHDGTAIRDYVHVIDIAEAHVKALEYLLQDKPSVILNLGTGRGFSVQEVVDVVRSVTGKKISIKDCPRRPGDPTLLTADSKLAKELLGWEPKNSDLKTIVESEWNWLQSLERVERVAKLQRGL